MHRGLDPEEQTPMKFEQNICSIYEKCTLKYRLRDGGQFVLGYKFQLA